ncbi:DUF357 domain-containing protein [Archaeoglobus veneficus]|uniref:DUF357 domain-containing protein n=1 Tax=Archaeoglobus veneficus (strain DSM 11195 / SNP6) TaxID=693661 RepID=F2KRN8_ARCVS|nr:DUF357 domain-containing protein [Archaeoglobus veneficus]AEA47902.1 Domain of unknown function DUF357 [Archaeoglobus veneficus SNP6]
MRDVALELESETKKWFERLKTKMKDVRARNDKGDEFIRNIEAYISDTMHFLSTGDLVRAFECVVWAWAWLEIGLELGLLEYRGQ